MTERLVPSSNMRFTGNEAVLDDQKHLFDLIKEREA